LEVQRADLIDADDHLGVARLGIDGPVHQPVQVQDPVLLGRKVRVAGLLPGLQALQRHALLVEQDPQASWQVIVDHPSATRNSASLAKLQVENGRSWSWGRDRASCLVARRWARVKVGGRPPR
jgi:hypothetical protein